jgi:hypothetical protein
MSTSDASSSSYTNPAVTLPPGVTAGPARETSQTNQQGNVVQGVLVPITLPSGGTTTVFVPYSVLSNSAQVQALFDNRINALLALPGQTS